MSLVQTASNCIAVVAKLNRGAATLVADLLSGMWFRSHLQV